MLPVRPTGLQPVESESSEQNVRWLHRLKTCVPLLFHRLQLDVALPAPNPVAASFQLDNDDKRMVSVAGRVLQLLFIDPGIVLKPVIVNRPFRVSRSVN